MSTCFCCSRRHAELCSCVFSTCRRCLFCLTHCVCPLRHARRCEPDPEIDAPDGPFWDLVNRDPNTFDSELTDS
jgi:hypothetical protein